MRRRGALAAVSVGAALVAVWAAASSGTSSRPVANRGVQSVILSVLLPVVVFVLVAGLVLLAYVLWQRAAKVPGEDPDEDEETDDRLARAATIIASLLILGLFFWFVYTSRNHHHAVQGLLGPATSRSGAPQRSGKGVPLNNVALATTSALLLGLVALALARSRLVAWFRHPRKLVPFVPPPELHFDSRAADAVAGGAAAQAPSLPPDPAAEPDPRRAILLAYQRFVLLMSRAGMARSDSETPFEYCDRVRHAGPVRAAGAGAGAATATLTTLFSAARYGREPVSAADRTTALDSLGVIATEVDGP